MANSLPYELINHVSTFLDNADHLALISSAISMLEACTPETKKKYVSKMGAPYFCAIGDLDTLQYCHRVGIPVNIILDVPANHGNLEIMKWLYETFQASHTPFAMQTAARIGNLDMVQFLDSIGAEVYDQTAAVASMGGYLDIVKFITERYEITRHENVAIWAAEGGYLNIVVYCFENNFPFPPSVMGAACENGHYKMVKYLCNDCMLPCDETALYDACSKGHLEIVEFLCDHYSNLLYQDTIEMAISCSDTSYHWDIVEFLNEVSTMD